MDEITRYADELRRLENLTGQLREQLRSAILEARRGGVSQADLVRLTGWSRETIRKIERRSERPRTQRLAQRKKSE